MNKTVTFPLTIKQLGEIGSADDNFYLVDYGKSELKGISFIEYFGSISKICDISNYHKIDKETKFAMMNHHFQLPEFVMLPSLVRSMVLCLLDYKGIEYNASDLRGSFLTKSEIKEYIKVNKEKIIKYVNYFESFLYFMLIVGKYMIREEDITIDILDKEFDNIKVDDCSDIPFLINSVLFDSLFDKYFEKTLISDIPTEVKYYKKLWTEPLYKNHSIMFVLTTIMMPTFKGILYMFDKAKEVKC